MTTQKTKRVMDKAKDRRGEASRRDTGGRITLREKGASHKDKRRGRWDMDTSGDNEGEVEGFPDERVQFPSYSRRCRLPGGG